MMTWAPFVMMGIGLILGMRNLPAKLMWVFDQTVNVVLVILMMTVGMNIGTNEQVFMNLGAIGLQCVALALAAAAGSIVLVMLAEKTVLPLAAIRKRLAAQQMESVVDMSKDEGKKSPLLLIMPVSIIVGLAVGWFLLPHTGAAAPVLDIILTVAMLCLYLSVGVSMGSNKIVFQYMKLLGWRVIFLPIAILIGSLGGGLLVGSLMGLPLHVSLMSGGGMCYYSLTGAYMTQMFGIGVGAYGYLTNVLREFMVVLLLPLLQRLSTGAAIAAGGAADMDTMLVPVTKATGPELGLVTLVSGIILTFVVPFLMPALAGLATIMG